MISFEHLARNVAELVCHYNLDCPPIPLTLKAMYEMNECCSAMALYIVLFRRFSRGCGSHLALLPHVTDRQSN